MRIAEGEPRNEAGWKNALVIYSTFHALIISNKQIFVIQIVFWGLDRSNV